MGATKHTVKPTTSQRVTELHGFGTDSVRVLMEDVMTAKLHLSSQTYVALWLSLSPLSLWIIRMNRWCLIFIYLFIFSVWHFAAQKSKDGKQNYRLIIITSSEEVVFHPCWFVCLFDGWFVGLSAWLHKNNWMHLHKTWVKDGSQLRTDPRNFWCGSRRRDRSRSLFLTFFMTSNFDILRILWKCLWSVSTNFSNWLTYYSL